MQVNSVLASNPQENQEAALNLEKLGGLDLADSRAHAQSLKY
jgi:hypothetical protein